MEESKGHGFSLGQLEKFAEAVARTGSNRCHEYTSVGWVETAVRRGPARVRCFVDHDSPRFCWSNIGVGACIWHEFPSLERQAMADAWYRTRAQAAAADTAPVSKGHGHGFTLVQLEDVVTREARTRTGQPYVLGADGAWVVTPEPPVGVVPRRTVLVDAHPQDGDAVRVDFANDGEPSNTASAPRA